MKTHCYVGDLTPRNKVYSRTILNHLLEPLLADIEGGDITTSALLPLSQKIKAKLVAKQAGILAGTSELKFFLSKRWASASERKLFGAVRFLGALDDGAAFRRGAILAVIVGNVGDVLKLERTMLNFLQRMSGVATMARAFVASAHRGGSALVCPTRKTPWGLLDKRACVLGGAGRHRLSLSDAVLVKDTHLDLIGHDFGLLGTKFFAAARLGRFVEVEVESLADAWKAVDVLRVVQKKRRIPCFVMLDNMKVSDVRKFVDELRCPSAQQANKIFIEVSGGITLANIQKYARSGVDVISVGAMTHSAPAIDISLKII